MLQDPPQKKPQHFLKLCEKSRSILALELFGKGWEEGDGGEKWLKYTVREGKHSSRHFPRQVQSCSIADSSGLATFSSSSSIGESFWAELSAVVSIASA